VDSGDNIKSFINKYSKRKLYQEYMGITPTDYGDKKKVDYRSIIYSLEIHKELLFY